MKILSIFFFTFSNYCQAQSFPNEFNFINVPTNIIKCKPILVTLTNEDLTEYFYTDYQNKLKVNRNDSLLIAEMILNKKNDTSNWTHKELPNTFIVRNNIVELEKNGNNLKVNDSINNLLRTRYEKDCEYGDISKEKLYSVSRPIFDKSKTLALVQYELLNCKNEGYIKVKLYKKSEIGWWTFIDDIFSIKRQTICFAPNAIK